MTTSSLRIKPHARLLTMLGDQLIKNERIALVEVIKNSYDADASWVKVTFANFGPNFGLRSDSMIIVEDDGTGMTREVLTKHWISPATPVKKIAKSICDTTPKGRKIQGEKGIGRFALLKLGRTVKIVSRPAGESDEFTLTLDLDPYDDDFLSRGGKATTDLTLDAIPVPFSESQTPSITGGPIQLANRNVSRLPQGTRIEITHLRGSWTKKKVDEVYEDLVRLQSIFDSNFSIESEESTLSPISDFEVLIYKDRDFQPFPIAYIRQLRDLLAEKSVFRFTQGQYDEEKRVFKFRLNDQARTLRLDDPELTGLKIFRDNFGEPGESLRMRTTQCGSFRFEFYVFDFNRDPNSKYFLDKEDRGILKRHRIYLYRDGIRVYPYGDEDDDWLRIDAFRGTISAAWFLSNDQVVGHVDITHTGNPKLTDKTNREGLLYIDTATEDFIHLLQVFLAWVRKGPYARYVAELRLKRVSQIVSTNQVQESLQVLADKIGENKAAQSALEATSKLYKQERTYLIQRAETTESLAGVGLSVETAAHDIMAVLHRGLVALDALILDVGKPGTLSRDALSKELSSLRGMFSFVEAQLKDVQLLFKSSKQRRRDVRVSEVLEKVNKLFETSLKKEDISVQILGKGSPLVARTTDAVLLQLFLNLFDNAVYWLKSRDTGRKIEILLDGDEQTLVFADNGPGVNPDDVPYIFEPFFSGRGEDGRGLGLYIARQLLERQDYSIELASTASERILGGACFVISFVSGSRA